MAEQAKKEKVEKFVYVAGDANRAPVDFAAQPKGTKCFLVTPDGLEYPMTAGASRLAAEVTPEIQAKLDKAKSWDPKDAKFQNLKVPREG